ncbi:hypothetical protein TIFTF001_026697 [Ficus carica]|uniref:Uncharacterized protein n=1 Tax=Ficus carica TaxID=3494 RepID=A0AA88IZ02_FICCA|nr:hypothetical protein TIFTF001_026697 [Ficus carica]
MLEPQSHPLYSKSKWVYCSPLLPCPPVAWVFCPGRESLPPPYRRPCAVVSGAVASSSIPSTICEVAGNTVSASPPSIRLAFNAQNTPTSRAADEAPCEELEATLNPSEDFPVFPSSETSLASR